MFRKEYVWVKKRGKYLRLCPCLAYHIQPVHHNYLNRHYFYLWKRFFFLHIFLHSFQDLAPPLLNVLSASAIEVSWSLPKMPNGVIKVCAAYRNIDNAPIYSGLDNAYIGKYDGGYMDKKIETYNNYKDILQ